MKMATPSTRTGLRRLLAAGVASIALLGGTAKAQELTTLPSAPIDSLDLPTSVEVAAMPAINIDPEFKPNRMAQTRGFLTYAADIVPLGSVIARAPETLAGMVQGQDPITAFDAATANRRRDKIEIKDSAPQRVAAFETFDRATSIITKPWKILLTNRQRAVDDADMALSGASVDDKTALREELEARRAGTFKDEGLRTRIAAAEAALNDPGAALNGAVETVKDKLKRSDKIRRKTDPKFIP